MPICIIPPTDYVNNNNSRGMWKREITLKMTNCCRTISLLKLGCSAKLNLQFVFSILLSFYNSKLFCNVAAAYCEKIVV